MDLKMNDSRNAHLNLELAEVMALVIKEYKALKPPKGYTIDRQTMALDTDGANLRISMVFTREGAT